MSATAQSVSDDIRTQAEPAQPVISEVVEEKREPPAAEPSPEPGRQIDPREEIARKYQQREHGKQPLAQAESAPPEGTAEAAPPADPEPESRTVKVRINGQDREVARAKIEAAGGVETYQKTVAADEGLRDLAEQRKVVHQQAAQLQAWEQQLQARQRRLPTAEDAKPTDPPESGDREASLTDAARKYRQALLDEEDETLADQALVDLLALARDNPATGPLNPETIAQQASQAAVRAMDARQYQHEVQSGRQAFAEEFADVANDPRLFQMADAETTVISREHPDWSPRRIIAEAGARIRNWRDGQQANGTADKIERKRALNTPRAAAGRDRQAASPRPESPSEYIARLRKSRGLA